MNIKTYNLPFPPQCVIKILIIINYTFYQFLLDIKWNTLVYLYDLKRKENKCIIRSIRRFRDVIKREHKNTYATNCTCKTWLTSYCVENFYSLVARLSFTSEGNLCEVLIGHYSWVLSIVKTFVVLRKFIIRSVKNISPLPKI